MTNALTSDRANRLLADMLEGRLDPVALSEAHGLRPDELARWVSQPPVRQCLAGLCLLADMQTQWMLSRYRLNAATRLIQLATNENDTSDMVRKACVDLLKIELVRTQSDEHEDVGESDDGDLRSLLYGSEGGSD